MRTLLAIAVLAFAAGAAAQESKVQLKDGPGKDKAMQCVACHSLDYIPMNSVFQEHKGWEATVNKMVKVMGAPIPAEDVPTIIDYLTKQYGK